MTYEGKRDGSYLEALSARIRKAKKEEKRKGREENDKQKYDLYTVPQKCSEGSRGGKEKKMVKKDRVTE